MYPNKIINVKNAVVLIYQDRNTIDKWIANFVFPAGALQILVS